MNARSVFMMFKLRWTNYVGTQNILTLPQQHPAVTNGLYITVVLSFHPLLKKVTSTIVLSRSICDRLSGKITDIKNKMKRRQGGCIYANVKDTPVIKNKLIIIKINKPVCLKGKFVFHRSPFYNSKESRNWSCETF